MSRKQGVNVIGYLQAEFGLGEIARKLAFAAESGGIPTSTVSYGRTVHRQQHDLRQLGSGDAPFDTNIICVNADQLPYVHADLGPRVLSGRYSVGVWFWEISHFPANLHASFDLVDEIWVASEFTRDAISAVTKKPVRVVPIPLEPPAPPTLGRAELGLPRDISTCSRSITTASTPARIRSESSRRSSGRLLPARAPRC